MKTLHMIWNKWRAFGQWMADMVGRLVMLVFFFTLAAPFGIGVRLFSDPLQLRRTTPAWEPREASTESALDEARRSF